MEKYIHHVAINYQNVCARIKQKAQLCGRDPSTITLLAVSKTKTPELITQAWDAGIRTFGENRVQEIQKKFDPRPHEEMELHMIGHLQSNKVRAAVQLSDWIQSVDREKILHLISKEAQRYERTIQICLEVNTSAEESKFGVLRDEEVIRLAVLAAKLPCVKLRGLMTIGPLLSEGEKALRNAFIRLRKLFHTIGDELAPPLWDTLSMGMSNDFEIAIEEGATMLRIGSSLFGLRK
ncbi:MAG: YggS family pyridoxal phosphate-dependent enzyme [Salinispira sp.]